MKEQSIWIAGAEGKLGSALRHHLKTTDFFRVVTTDKDVDILDAEAVTDYANMNRPAVVINCVGLSDEKRCEENMVEAFRVNALGARNLAVATRSINAKIIHISTDDVFGGEKKDKLTEFDMPVPTSIYGKSKLAGENYVRELNPKHLIVRSSWIYAPAENDFLTQVLEKAKAGEKIEASLDHISTPTSAEELAKFIEVLLMSKEYGIYHASCEGACSRYHFAKAALGYAGFNTELVEGVFENHGDVHTKYTILENLMMKMTAIYEMPKWETALQNYIGTLGLIE